MEQLLINKKTLSRQVYDALRADILTGRLAPGEKLTNVSLQERFGVSAIPIRDAVIRLQQDGVIDEISRVGARVAALGPGEAREICELARLLCVSALRLSFERENAGEVVRALEKAMRIQRAHMEDERYFDGDYDFHISFFNYCGNSHYRKVYRQYSVFLEMISRRALNACADAFRRARVESVSAHERIAAAYAAGEVEAAAREMAAHYETGLEELRAFLQG